MRRRPKRIARPRATSGGSTKTISPAVLRNVAGRWWHAAGERGGKVGEVAIAVGARADDELAKTMGVRFAPAISSPWSRPEQRLVRRACEGRDAADGSCSSIRRRPALPSAAEPRNSSGWIRSIEPTFSVVGTATFRRAWRHVHEIEIGDAW